MATCASCGRCRRYLAAPAVAGAAAASPMAGGGGAAARRRRLQLVLDGGYDVWKITRTAEVDLLPPLWLVPVRRYAGYGRPRTEFSSDLSQ